MNSTDDPRPKNASAPSLPTDRALYDASDAAPTPGAEQRTTVPCFAPGTRIMTSMGLRAIEDLTPGDLVLTKRHGYCTLSWVGQRHLSEADIPSNLRPIHIGAHSLAPGRPARTLTVCPKLNLILPSDTPSIAPSPKTCSAESLKTRKGVEQLRACDTIYVMITLDLPDMVQAEGIWCETGSALTDCAAETMSLFPELAPFATA